MIEVGNHPESMGAVILHSTESGQFLGATRLEFERLAAAIKRGDLDPFLRMAETSAIANGDADWTVPTRLVSSITGEPLTGADSHLGRVRGYQAGGRMYAPEDVVIIREP